MAPRKRSKRKELASSRVSCVPLWGVFAFVTIVLVAGISFIEHQSWRNYSPRSTLLDMIFDNVKSLNADESPSQITTHKDTHGSLPPDSHGLSTGFSKDSIVEYENGKTSSAFKGDISSDFQPLEEAHRLITDINPGYKELIEYLSSFDSKWILALIGFQITMLLIVQLRKPKSASSYHEIKSGNPDLNVLEHHIGLSSDVDSTKDNSLPEIHPQMISQGDISIATSALNEELLPVIELENGHILGMLNERELNRSNHVLTKLKDDYSDITCKYNDVANALKAAVCEIESLKSSETTTKDVNSMLETDLRHSKLKHKEAQDEVSTLTTVIERQSRELEKAVEETEELRLSTFVTESRIGTLREDNKCLRGEIAEVAWDRDEAQKEAVSLSKGIVELQLRNEKAYAELSAVKEKFIRQVDVLEEEKHVLIKENTQLIELNVCNDTEARQLLSELDQERRYATDLKRSSEAQVATLSNYQTDLEAKVTALKKAVVLRNELFEEQRHVVEELLIKQSVLEIRNERLLEQNSDYLDSIETFLQKRNTQFARVSGVEPNHVNSFVGSVHEIATTSSLEFCEVQCTLDATVCTYSFIELIPSIPTIEPTIAALNVLQVHSPSTLSNLEKIFEDKQRELKSCISSLEEEIVVLHSNCTCNELKLYSNSLSLKVTEHDLIVDELNSKIDALRFKLCEYEQDKDLNEMKTSDMADKSTKMSQLISSLEYEKSRLLLQSTESINLSSTLKTEVEQLKYELSQMTNAKENIVTQLSLLQHRIASVEHENRDLTLRVNREVELVAALRKNNRVLKQELEAEQLLSKSHVDSENELFIQLSDVRSECTLLKKSLRYSEEQLQDIEFQLYKSRVDQSKLEEVELELKLANAELAILRDESDLKLSDPIELGRILDLREGNMQLRKEELLRLKNKEVPTPYNEGILELTKERDTLKAELLKYKNLERELNKVRIELETVKNEEKKLIQPYPDNLELRRSEIDIAERNLKLQIDVLTREVSCELLDRISDERQYNLKLVDCQVENMALNDEVFAKITEIFNLEDANSRMGLCLANRIINPAKLDDYETMYIELLQQVSRLRNESKALHTFNTDMLLRRNELEDEQALVLAETLVENDNLKLQLKGYLETIKEVQWRENVLKEQIKSLMEESESELRILRTAMISDKREIESTVEELQGYLASESQAREQISKENESLKLNIQTLKVQLGSATQCDVATKLDHSGLRGTENMNLYDAIEVLENKLKASLLEVRRLESERAEATRKCTSLEEKIVDLSMNTRIRVENLEEEAEWKTEVYRKESTELKHHLLDAERTIDELKAKNDEIVGVIKSLWEK